MGPVGARLLRPSCSSLSRLSWCWRGAPTPPAPHPGLPGRIRTGHGLLRSCLPPFPASPSCCSSTVPALAPLPQREAWAEPHPPAPPGTGATSHSWLPEMGAPVSQLLVLLGPNTGLHVAPWGMCGLGAACTCPPSPFSGGAQKPPAPRDPPSQERGGWAAVLGSFGWRQRDAGAAWLGLAPPGTRGAQTPGVMGLGTGFAWSRGLAEPGPPGEAGGKSWPPQPPPSKGPG